MTEQVLFTEKQRFNQVWLWILMGAITLIPFYGIYNQVILGKPFGNHPMSNSGLYIFAVLMSLFTFALLRILTLETRITASGIDARFYPFHTDANHYSWEDMDSAVVRTYSPLAEYGGWGLKWGSNGKAYNVSGDQGIQLVFKNGNKLLIGTNKPVEAAAALARYMPVK